jgi:hypothetical protein
MNTTSSSLNYANSLSERSGEKLFNRWLIENENPAKKAGPVFCRTLKV